MNRTEENVVDISTEITISRDCKPEYNFPYAEVDNLEVVNEEGTKIPFREIYENQRTIVVFIRHFLCFMAKEYVDDFAKIPKSFLEEAGVRLVIIGCGEFKFIRAFRRATGYRYNIFADPERNLYKALNLKANIGDQSIKKSKHIKSGILKGVLESTWRGLQFCEFQGDMNQLGGAFILGPGKQCHFHHTEIFPADQVAINDLLAMSDVQQVNFPKDTRVLQL